MGISSHIMPCIDVSMCTMSITIYLYVYIYVYIIHIVVLYERNQQVEATHDYLGSSKNKGPREAANANEIWWHQNGALCECLVALCAVEVLNLKIAASESNILQVLLDYSMYVE